jgi:hypothetical protein
MTGMDALTGTISVPAWALGATVALFVVLLVVAFSRFGGSGTLVRLCAVVVAAVLAGALLERMSAHDRLAERRALDGRMADLAGRAMAPGSPLHCLDALAGQTVEGACEKVLFAAPETVAAAVSYVAAGLALLADGVDFANRSDATYEKSLAGLRQAIETDRFGIVAHVLATRDKCTAEQCDAFALLHDASHVQQNLKDETFENYVAHNADAWPARVRSGGPMAQDGTANNSEIASAHAKPVSPQYDFPSAASIPPVSIMSAEPGTPPAGEASVSTAQPEREKIVNPPTPPRRPPAVRAAPQRSSGPVPISPFAAHPTAEAAPSQSTPRSP